MRAAPASYCVSLYARLQKHAAQRRSPGTPVTGVRVHVLIDMRTGNTCACMAEAMHSTGGPQRCAHHHEAPSSMHAWQWRTGPALLVPSAPQQCTVRNLALQCWAGSPMRESCIGEPPRPPQQQIQPGLLALTTAHAPQAASCTMNNKPVSALPGPWAAVHGQSVPPSCMR